MPEMATVPVSPQTPGESGEHGPGRARGTAAWAVAALAGSAVLGLLGGLAWGELAPRATLREVATGTAVVINSETRAFIGADIWFCGIAAVAGLITGLLGYRLAVSRRAGGARALVAAALIAGAVAGEFVMLWLGEQMGLSAYTQHLASSPAGTVYPASLALGAKSALAFWPLLTAATLLIAEWSAQPAAGAADEDAEPPAAPDTP